VPAPKLKEAQESTPSRGTVLIIEDNPAVPETLQLLFDAEGHRTVVAADWHKALELAVQQSPVPDLIIADYNLPKCQAQHTIPAIVLTGDISTDSLREIGAHGCVHLNKPVRATELTRLTQRLMARPRPTACNDCRFFWRGKSPPPSLSSTTTAPSAMAMRDLLSENGYAVELFADGEAFLGGYGAGREGCLLVDVLMPDMSGVELIEGLKAEGHQLPAIMIAGSGAVPMVVQAMKAGGCGFHREASGPRRAARQRQARTRSDAGHRHAVCTSG
jgi:two-component system, chemotaxis family, CheB/CheR fusion protein